MSFRLEPINALSILIGKASEIQPVFCLSYLRERKNQKRWKNATKVQLGNVEDIFFN